MKNGSNMWGRSRSRWAKLVPLAISAGLGLLACRSPDGERAEANGDCPVGETCSYQTPGGLRFKGAPFLGREEALLQGTALFGTQTISAQYGSEPHAPYVAGFDADILDERIATLEAARPTSVFVFGASEGTTLLRLREPGTNNLLDRIELKVAAISKIILIPAELLTNLGAIDSGWAMLARSRPMLWVGLRDSTGDLLVDEGLEVSSHGAQITRHAWDLYEVAAPPSGSVSFAVRAAGRQSLTEAQIVGGIDEISYREGEPEPLALALHEERDVCFIARSAGKRVAGATWAFHPVHDAGDGEIAARPSSEWQYFTNCVTLTGTQAGATQLAVTASGRRQTFDVVVTE